MPRKTNAELAGSKSDRPTLKAEKSTHAVREVQSAYIGSVIVLVAVYWLCHMQGCLFITPGGGPYTRDLLGMKEYTRVRANLSRLHRLGWLYLVYISESGCLDSLCILSLGLLIDLRLEGMTRAALGVLLAIPSLVKGRGACIGPLLTVWVWLYWNCAMRILSSPKNRVFPDHVASVVLAVLCIGRAWCLPRGRSRLRTDLWSGLYTREMVRYAGQYTVSMCEGRRMPPQYPFDGQRYWANTGWAMECTLEAMLTYMDSVQAGVMDSATPVIEQGKGTWYAFGQMLLIDLFQPGAEIPRTV